MDKEENERKRELNRMKDELAAIDKMNKKIAENVYLRDQQTKEDIRNTLAHQIDLKKEREEKLKAENNNHTSLPIAGRYKPDTGTCG